jgi:hypothetical protein
MGDPSRGIFGKFKIERTDGRSERGEKHYGCAYFVLDLSHDEHAKVVMQAYADSCRAEYPLLAKDIDRWVAGEDYWFIMCNPSTE